MGVWHMKTNVQSPSNPFFTNVEKRFDIFKTKICKMAQKAKIGFDEDIFMDTLVKCMHTFSNPNPTDDDVDRYFWSAYKRNSYNSITRDRIRNRVDIDTLPEAIDEDGYNENIDNIVSIIEEEVRARFGDNAFEAWWAHTCENKTYKELDELGYGDVNYHNEFRQIKRYITGKFLKRNDAFRELVMNENLI
jgi:hypothetical protein